MTIGKPLIIRIVNHLNLVNKKVIIDAYGLTVTCKHAETGKHLKTLSPDTLR